VWRLIAVGLATVLALPGLGAASAGSPDVFRGPGLVLRYPASLYVSNRLLNNWGNPVQRFVLSTYRVPDGQPNLNGDYTPPPTGVIAQVLEDVPPPDPGFEAGPRPNRFRLPKLSNYLEGFGNRWGEIAFRDQTRCFYIFIGVGRLASPAQIALVLHTLDGLTIGAPPPSVTGA
jgi:hypothetical protein